MRISSSNVIHRTTSLSLLRFVCFLLFHCRRHSVQSYTTVSLNSFRLIVPLSSTYVCLVSISHVLAIEHHPMDSMHVTLPESDSMDHLSISDKAITKDTYNKLIDNNNNPSKTPTKFPCDAGAVSSSSSSSDGNGGTSSDSSSGGDDSNVPSPMSSPSHVLRFTKVLSQQHPS